MKRTFFIVNLILIIVLSFFSSCRQCSVPKDGKRVDDKDTALYVRALDEINEAIKKDSLNPNLYFRRAQLHQGQNDLKSALSDMYLAVMLDSANSDYNLYAADL